jgi:hypothetical protein
VTADVRHGEHRHPHPHPGSEPASYGASHEGAVVVDIGGTIGALIIDTPATMADVEIEISPVGSAKRTHVAVRERHGSGPVQHAAVFPALAAGTYTLWGPGGEARSTVEVVGGQVTRAAW